RKLKKVLSNCAICIKCKFRVKNHAGQAGERTAAEKQLNKAAVGDTIKQILDLKSLRLSKVGRNSQERNKMGLMQKIFGTHSEREIKLIKPIADKVVALRPD